MRTIPTGDGVSLNEVERFIAEFRDMRDHYLYGKCYWFSVILQQRFKRRHPTVYYDAVGNHWATMIDGVLYDASGAISTEGFERWDTLVEQQVLNYEALLRDCINYYDKDDCTQRLVFSMELQRTTSFHREVCLQYITDKPDIICLRIIRYLWDVEWEDIKAYESVGNDVICTDIDTKGATNFADYDLVIFKGDYNGTSFEITADMYNNVIALRGKVVHIGVLQGLGNRIGNNTEM